MGSIFLALKIVFLGLAALVIIVKGVCPLLLPLVSLIMPFNNIWWMYFFISTRHNLFASKATSKILIKEGWKNKRADPNKIGHG